MPAPLYPSLSIKLTHANASPLFLSSQNNILQSLIAETTPSGDAPAPYKFAVNSTLVQHSTPRPSSAGGEAAPVAASAGAHGGRRGMHSATGAYWNEERDGMWSFKWDGGEEKGMDVVVAVLWFSL